MKKTALCFLALWLVLPCLITNAFAQNPPDPPPINLSDFGAAGDGVTDDGPAFQKALDALAASGGGTLNIPEGKYAIATPVSKDFSGSASSITIAGVESLKPVAPPTAPGHQLAEGLDLLTEIYPRTGINGTAISLSGLRSVLIKDIAFVGTATVVTDAAITVSLTDIDKAQIKHSEFYGLATLAAGGAIVKAVRSELEITQSKFLGSTANSGLYIPLVENREWRGITITETTFLDYGLRPELFSKTGMGSPISWINIGDAAPTTNTSPRREVVLRNVFLDEGGYWGLSSNPYRYSSASAPIDLIYVTGLVMNVSNFGQLGHYLYDAQRVFIEKSSYGWSHNAFAAIGLWHVGTGILDQLNCVADADRIYADPYTEKLTVINSTYSQLDSSAASTNTIDTATVEEDPVQYVRARFAAVLGRDPDAAAHFYWSDLLINCSDAVCQDLTKDALDNYLSQDPAPVFAISGRVADEQDNPLTGVTLTLSGSQSVTTTTDANGNYFFANLPTSGEYVVTPSQTSVVFDTASFVTPNADRIANFIARPKPPEVKKYSISGRVLSVTGEPMPGVALTLSGAVSRTTTTANDGSYSFAEIIGGTSCTVTASKDGYLMSPAVQTFNDLAADAVADFKATQLPVLLTIPDSDRAVALELTQLIPEPFPITTTLLSEGRNRTRIMVFGTNLGLLEGEGVEMMTAEAQDSQHVVYPLRVEFITPLPGTPGINQIVLRLTSDLENAGDVYVMITVKGLTSNKVRVAIAP